MFGKGGGPLGAWIKEFCELVFIQTLQAFIFALTISFIVNILSNQATMDATDKNTSLGIICIVALTSIFKIEEIARRIFGYGPTKADHGNAIRGIGKTMFAFQMGKNLLDNGRKVVGGIGAMATGHSAKVKELKRVRKRREALNKDNGPLDNDTMPLAADAGKTASNANEPKTERKIDGKKREEKIRLTEQAQRARKMAMTEKDEKRKKALIAEAHKKLEMAHSIDDTLREPQVTADVKSSSSDVKSSSSSKGRVKDYNQKLLQIEEDHKSKMSDIKKKQREGFKSMVSGAAETGAALVGFTAGTAMSAASSNDWGEAAKDGLSWAGAADKVTSLGVDMTFDLEKFAEDRVRGAVDIAKEYGTDARNAIDKNVSEALENAKKNADRGLIKAAKVAAAASKGSIQGVKTTARNHSVKAQNKLNKEQLENVVARTDDKDTFR